MSDYEEIEDAEDGLTLAVDHVPELVDELDLSDDVTETATRLAQRHGGVEGPTISGSPSGVAAAAVYSSALLKNEPRTQPEVASAADRSAPTLRENFHEMWEAERQAAEGVLSLEEERDLREKKNRAATNRGAVDGGRDE